MSISVNAEITETNCGWILYDGECAFCRAGVARCYRMLRRRGFKFAALQAPWVAPRFGLPLAGLLVEMRLALPDGRILGGADALMELARGIWWARPVYWLSRLPGAMPLLRVAYRGIAVRRHCLSRGCRMPGVRSLHNPEHSITSGFYELP